MTGDITREITVQEIQSRIIDFLPNRPTFVPDRDLVVFCETETKRINEAVKRIRNGFCRISVFNLLKMKRKF